MGRRTRWRVTVTGIVQGVGFRPFVHRLAVALGLGGHVHNFTGGVHIEVEGPDEKLARFIERLRREAPPAAAIRAVTWQEIPLLGQDYFVIAASQTADSTVLCPPDIAICSDCRRELAEATNRRYRHPFINCTNCGPRFTLIRCLPYDRVNTSMAVFEMCEDCHREYEDISDRRYHAQPVCCPNCGPVLWLADSEGACLASGEEALRRARNMLRAGEILAVKGLGGFHLACDATNETAVAELRRLKNRWVKPLAVMAASVEAVELFAHLTEDARRLLESPAAPIVLLPKRLPERLAPSVAPDSPDYGVMLAYTPVHVLLLGQWPADRQGRVVYGGEGAQEGFLALVMTSGNMSEEPICTANEEAFGRLKGVAGAFLVHDRDILVGGDDSVVRVSEAGPVMIRRSRGYVPRPVLLPLESPPAAGVGGHLKNTFCLAKGAFAYPSQHVGDLDRAETLEYFERGLSRLEELLEICPEVVACDLHPDYLSTRVAEKLAAERGLGLVRVQHHHAHFAACLADNGMTGPAVGLICDGTGYGEDGTIWGCEILVGDLAGYERVGHLRYVGLPGGEKAIEEPWRVAVGWLADAFGADWGHWPLAGRRLVEAVGPQRAEAVITMLRRGINCPHASSAGRLFDAVAALLGLKLVADYEAQAAMALEAHAAAALGARTWVTPDAHAATASQAQAARALEGGLATSLEGRACRRSREPAAYEFEIDEEHVGEHTLLVMDPRPIFGRICGDLEAGVPIELVAARFHDTFAAMLVAGAEAAAQISGLQMVVLSGGTFQNRLVLEKTVERLGAAGLQPVWHRDLSPNDSGLCVGQVAVAAARLAEGARLTERENRAGRETR
ncbi:MAG: carbamoyltransferase HypF [Armatimonadetes bacterium]|nr:carbamoyltransferase HypF [Armatimonadota bacterium]